MGHLTGLGSSDFLALCRQSNAVVQDIAIRRAETEERIARAKSRSLEREFGNSDAAGFLRGRPHIVAKTIPAGARIRRRSAKSRLISDYSVPAVMYRQRRSAEGLRSFHYSIEPIPKSARVRQLASGTKIGPGCGSARVRYTIKGEGADRQPAYLLGERVQSDFLGRPLIISNISKNVAEISNFFSLVEENERDAKLDKVEINFSKHRKTWRQVVDDPACEPELVRAYRANRGDSTVGIELEQGSAALKELLSKHGFVSADAALPDERRQAEDGIKWTDGRGGRIQWRMVVALPAEFSGRQRRRAVEAICRRLGSHGAMYAAVIHEPVASNHERNFHVHIDLYDRPCRRLSGDRRDLDNVSQKWLPDIERELANGRLRHLKGQWDFAAARRYKSSSGNWISHRPFRAKKCAFFRPYKLPERHRAEVARIINGIAEAYGHGKLYDPRPYREMGIYKDSDERLGPKAHGLEGKGVPTTAGMRNEQRHVEADRKLIDARLESSIEEIEKQRAALRKLNVGTRHTDQDERFELADRALFDCKMLARARHAAEHAQLEMQRQLSRARSILRIGHRAIRNGEDPKGEHRERMADARTYWRAWQQLNAESIDQLRQLHKYLKRKEELIAYAKLCQAAAVSPASPAREAEHYPVTSIPVVSPSVSQTPVSDSTREPDGAIPATGAPAGQQPAATILPSDRRNIMQKRFRPTPETVIRAEAARNPEPASVPIHAKVKELGGDAVGLPSAYSLSGAHAQPKLDGALDLPGVLHRPDVDGRTSAEQHTIQETDLCVDHRPADIRPEGDVGGSEDAMIAEGQIQLPLAPITLSSAADASVCRHNQLEVHLHTGDDNECPGDPLANLSVHADPASAERSRSDMRQAAPPISQKPDGAVSDCSHQAQVAVTSKVEADNGMSTSSTDGGKQFAAMPDEAGGSLVNSRVVPLQPLPAPPSSASGEATATAERDQAQISSHDRGPELLKPKGPEDNGLRQHSTAAASGSAQPVARAGSEKERPAQTKEQVDELLRWFRSEEEVRAKAPKTASAGQLGQAAMDRPEAEERAVADRLIRLERRLVRLISDDGFIMAAPNAVVSDKDLDLIRDHQAECRLIKDRQDARLTAAGEFLFERAFELAAGETVSCPLGVKEVIKAWPDESVFAYCAELIKSHQVDVGPRPTRGPDELSVSPSTTAKPRGEYLKSEYICFDDLRRILETARTMNAEDHVADVDREKATSTGFSSQPIVRAPSRAFWRPPGGGGIGD